MATRRKLKRAKAVKGTKGKPARRTARKAAKRTARKTAKRAARKAAKGASAKRVRPAIRRAHARPATAAARPPLAQPVKTFDDWAAPRCRSRIPVDIQVGGRCERGAIVDMSSSGARIVGVALELAPGTPLEIRYPSGTTLMSAEVVRATDDGFAVRILPR